MTAIKSKIVSLTALALIASAVSTPVFAKDLVLSAPKGTLTVDGGGKVLTPVPVKAPVEAPVIKAAGKDDHSAWIGGSKNPNGLVNCKGRIAGAYSYDEGRITRAQCESKVQKRIDALQAQGDACGSSCSM